MAAGRPGRRRTDAVETEWPTHRGGKNDTVRRSRRRVQRLFGVTVGVLLVAALVLFAAGYWLVAAAVLLGGTAMVLAAAIVLDFRQFVARGARTERPTVDDD